MYPLPQAAPISDMRNHQPEILKMAKEGPVMLTARGRAAAVLLAPEKWNEIAVRLRNLELLLEAKRIEAEIVQDPSRLVTDEELERQITEKAARHVAH
jgi:prevent-host-death family protein